ncbi:MAG: type I DNA topoisomerase [Chitinophagales bacterium]|nr:type I DNA topoisomerase [Chitinophagales bacterium]MDW8393657.1 type I DNA topoisomerase [Chitinophagales bacterium]
MAHKKSSKKTSEGINLMIVESPAKARTLEKFLDPSFLVKSSMGHIRDLPENDFGVDVKKNYQPTYVISEGKEKIVKELQKLVKKASAVWLATDEDREGEAISWHLAESLNLDADQTHRIVFHEITKPAVLEAIRHPRRIDMDLVNAQQARRIIDRMVGYELSPILWRKIPGQKSLSAGRVQSVAVRLIVEREREIMAFSPESFFRIHALFSAPDSDGRLITFRADLQDPLRTMQQAKEFLEQCRGARFLVEDVQVKPARKSPSAPFTTSTLQQEASRKLGFSVSRTMMVAQQLYESGKITYMRTDSTTLSELAVKAISEEIVRSYGEAYSRPRQYQSKIINAQEAHEAIRPTFIEHRTIEGSAEEQKLYQLIWKRTVASQMSDAQLERTTALISISTVADRRLIATGEVLLFDGFLKVYRESSDEETAEDGDVLLPPLAIGQQLSLNELVATERFTRPSPRYSEAALVKKLEELGIGRPSTYAPTISTILRRGYVEKRTREGTPREYTVLTMRNEQLTAEKRTEMVGAEKNRLVPTNSGFLTVDFLMEHFHQVMDYGFTAQIEKELDEIALGEKKWKKVVDEFYKPFHKEVDKTLQHAARKTGERVLGTDPASGRQVLVRMGRYGPMVQIGTAEDEDKPRFARLRSGQALETITLEEALALFRLPRSLGSYQGHEVLVGEGRYGPYVLHNKRFHSLKKDQDPMTIGLEEAIALIEEKSNNVIKEFPEEGILVLNGRYGPYIKKGAVNARIPKNRAPQELTLAECEQLLQQAKDAPPRRSRRTPSADK